MRHLQGQGTQGVQRTLTLCTKRSLARTGAAHTKRMEDDTCDSPDSLQRCAQQAATFMAVAPDTPRASAAGAVLRKLGLSFDSPGSVAASVDLVQQEGWVSSARGVSDGLAPGGTAGAGSAGG